MSFQYTNITYIVPSSSPFLLLITAGIIASSGLLPRKRPHSLPRAASVKRAGEDILPKVSLCSRAKNYVSTPLIETRRAQRAKYLLALWFAAGSSRRPIFTNTIKVIPLATKSKSGTSRSCPPQVKARWASWWQGGHRSSMRPYDLKPRCR